MIDKDQSIPLDKPSRTASLLKKALHSANFSGNSRDLLIEAREDDDAYAAAELLCSSPLTASSAKNSLRLLLVSSSEIEQFLETAASSFTTGDIAFLSSKNSIREELAILRKNPAVMIATPQRLIDHLRRDHLSLGTLTELIILRPERTDHLKAQDFDQDIAFITTKFSRHPKVAVITSDISETSPLIETLVKPETIKYADWFHLDTTLHYGSFNLLDSRKLADIIAQEELKLPLLIISGSGETPAETAAAFKESEFQFPVTVKRADEKIMSPTVPHALMFYKISAEYTLETLQSAFLLKDPSVIEYYCLSQEADQTFCNHLKEYFTMNRSLDEKTDRDKLLANKLEDLLKKITADKNPVELQEIRKLIRKTIPFSKRTYLAAYLVRELAGGATKSSPKKKPQPRQQITGDGATLFLSVGRRRRVFPKDIVKLFQETGNIPSDDILNIKVLDHFSFVTVNKEQADQAIKNIHGTEYRGRAITCDFAREKE